MDDIKITIRDDGSLAVTTDQISAPNHRNADELLQLLQTLMGGDVKATKLQPQRQQQGAVRRASHGR